MECAALSAYAKGSNLKLDPQIRLWCDVEHKPCTGIVHAQTPVRQFEKGVGNLRASIQA